MECFLLKAITKIISISVLVILVGSLHVFLGTYFGRNSFGNQNDISDDPQISIIKKMVKSQTEFLNNVNLLYY